MSGKRLLYIEGVMLLVAFIWGINPPIMKVGLVFLPPMAYNALRMLLASAISVAVLFLPGVYRPLDRADWPKLLLVSIVGFFVFQMFFTVGVQHTTAGNASLLLGLLPVSVAIINRVFRIEKISRQVLTGIGVTLCGVLFIVAGSGKEVNLGNTHLVGAAMLLMAQIGYGYYTVFSKPLIAKYSTYQISAGILVLSTILFVLVSLPELARTDWGAVPAAAWLSVLYSGAFAICIGNYLWIWGVGKLGSTRAALYNNLSPVFAIITGCVFLGETFGVLQFAGATAIFYGLYLTRQSGVLSEKQN